MALYAYLGTEVRSYPQYLDVTDAQKPLEAVPGESYAIAVVPGWIDAKGNSLLPVPPGDGQWAAQSLKTSQETKERKRAVNS